jgi:hypothetical protein
MLSGWQMSLFSSLHSQELIGASAFLSFESTSSPIFLKPIDIMLRRLLSLELSLGSSEGHGAGIGAGISFVGVREFSFCGASGSLVSISISAGLESLGKGQQLELHDTLRLECEVSMGPGLGFLGVRLVRMASCSRSALCWPH